MWFNTHWGVETIHCGLEIRAQVKSKGNKSVAIKGPIPVHIQSRLAEVVSVESVAMDWSEK